MSSLLAPARKYFICMMMSFVSVMMVMASAGAVLIMFMMMLMLFMVVIMMVFMVMIVASAGAVLIMFVMMLMLLMVVIMIMTAVAVIFVFVLRNFNIYFNRQECTILMKNLTDCAFFKKFFRIFGDVKSYCSTSFCSVTVC